MTKEIKFTEKNYAEFSKGKITTIRLGHKKNYEVGQGVMLVCDDTHEAKRSVIKKIEVLMLSDLTQRDIENDNLLSFAFLIKELQSCYKTKVSLGDVVTILTFVNNNGEIL